MNNRKKEVRNWRMQKISAYIIGIAILAVAAYLISWAYRGDPLVGDFKPIYGVITAIIGSGWIGIAYEWSFKSYVLQKRRRKKVVQKLHSGDVWNIVCSSILIAICIVIGTCMLLLEAYRVPGTCIIVFGTIWCCRTVTHVEKIVHRGDH